MNLYWCFFTISGDNPFYYGGYATLLSVVCISLMETVQLDKIYQRFDQLADKTSTLALEKTTIRDILR